MLELLIVIGRALTLAFRGHRELVLENLAASVLAGSPRVRLTVYSPSTCYWVRFLPGDRSLVPWLIVDGAIAVRSGLLNALQLPHGLDDLRERFADLRRMTG
jgi:hypothetical protein